MEKYNNPCRIGYTYSQDETLTVTVKYTGTTQDITDWLNKVKLYAILNGKYHNVIYNVLNDPMGLFTYTSNNFNHEAFVLSMIERVDNSDFIIDDELYYIGPTSSGGGGGQPTNITSPDNSLTIGGSGYDRTVIAHLDPAGFNILKKSTDGLRVNMNDVTTITSTYTKV
jgi:hypothetical protein